LGPFARRDPPDRPERDPARARRRGSDRAAARPLRGPARPLRGRDGPVRDGQARGDRLRRDALAAQEPLLRRRRGGRGAGGRIARGGGRPAARRRGGGGRIDFLIRRAEPADAAALVALGSAIGSEPEGWLITSEGWRGVTDERRYLRAIKRFPHAVVFVAEAE